MKKIIISLISISAIILMFQSCITTKAQKITIESGEIAPDMATEDFTLIGVLEGKRSYDKYVENAFADYSGKYVLATAAEIDNKYNDKNKFRYVLNYHLESGTIMQAKRTPGTNIVSYDSQETMHFRYYILDRRDGKEYLRNHASSMFSFEMRVYLMAINRIRKK